MEKPTDTTTPGATQALTTPPGSVIGSVMVRYCGEELEPAIVEVEAGDGFSFRVRFANSDTTTHARIDQLRPYDRYEYEAARRAYWHREHLRLAEFYSPNVEGMRGE